MFALSIAGSASGWDAIGGVLQHGPVLEVAFLDVGQGDAIYLRSPSGIEMLIDGGPHRGVMRALDALRTPFDRSIDMVLATHPDTDHVGGLPYVLAKYDVQLLLSTGNRSPTPADVAWRRAAGAEEVLRIAVRAGQVIALPDGVRIEFLYPFGPADGMETNASSAVVRIVYQDTEFLLTGDAPVSVEAQLVAYYGTQLESDVLKAGHHGSRTSTGEMFLRAVRPAHVVVSAGADNSYGHPHREVVERIRQFGAVLHATAKEGTVVFVSDGATVIRR